MAERQSLWLVPEEGSDEYLILEDLIQEYTGRYGDATAFQPHVTVVGSLEMGEEEAMRAAASLADRHEPVEITLCRPHCSTSHFQCVFLLAEPTAELLGLHKAAVEEYGRETGMYVPHLSLLYGSVAVEERCRMVEGFDYGILPVKFTARTLRLMDTTGGADNWSFIEDYSLL